MAEKDGFADCLHQAKHDFQIASVTTDGNNSIKTHMSKNEPDIAHELNVWQINKNLTKNLAKKLLEKYFR